jgi:hypothetical protein
MGHDNESVFFAGCLILGAVIMGGFIGYTAGSPVFAEIYRNPPHNFVSFLVSGISFVWGLMSFQIGDVPAWVSLGYDMIIMLCVVWPVFKVVRGSSS